jgi:hypothetical protein
MCSRLRTVVDWGYKIQLLLKYASAHDDRLPVIHREPVRYRAVVVHVGLGGGEGIKGTSRTQMVGVIPVPVYQIHLKKESISFFCTNLLYITQ